MEVDFEQEKYMTDEDTLQSDLIHLHDMNGSVIHKHAKGATMKLFFGTIGMSFSSECFVLDDGTEYCNEGDRILRMYVNGEENPDLENYELKDLDRILITYGDLSQEELEMQLDSVAMDSCIQSEKCPERGMPHDESTCTAVGCKAA